MVKFDAEFKRSVASDVFKQLAPLLKAYQEEVDALTNRAKLSEGAFLEVFKRLYDAPDPVPAIATSLEVASKAAELEAQMAKTSQELAEYKSESNHLKNQEITVRRLEETVRMLESQLAEKDAEVGAARQAAAAELEARSADEAREREKRLEAELQRAEAALEAMRRMHQTTQAQLFTVQERGEEVAAAARVEAEIAAAEVERAQERLLILAAERDSLLAKISSEDQEGFGFGQSKDGDDHRSSAGMDAANAAHVTALREELRAQRDLASRLQAELSITVQRTEAEQAAATSRVAGLQASLQATEAHAAALEAELSGRPTQADLEKAREQIRVLSAVVHNSVGDDADIEDAGSRDQKAQEASVAGLGTLESALLTKNRRLEHGLTMARLETADARTAAESAAGRVAELERELQEKKDLVAKLEEDLLAAVREDNAMHSGLTESHLGRTVSLSEAGGANGEQSLLGVLSAQRDRLRTRVSELEASLDKACHQLAQAERDLQATKADNVALVERLRYVQGYGGVGARADGDVEAGTRGSVLGKYMKEYEARVDPLNDFRSREREARRRAMPLQERAAFAVSSALVGGNKIARSAILLYALALHMIAFVVLAGFSHRHTSKMDALEEMCSHLGTAGSIVGGDGSANAGSLIMTDPVVGGAVAMAAKEALNALRRRILGFR